MAGGLRRGERAMILNEVAEVAVVFLADRRLQAHWLLADLDDLAYLIRRNLHLRRDLFGARLAAKLLQQATARANQPVDRLDHVHRDADGAGLVGDGASDSLANPPGGIGRELEP